MKKLLSIVLAMLLLSCAVVWSGCGVNKQFIVTFDIDGGTLIEGDQSILTQVVSSASEIVVPKVEKEGYRLSWDTAIGKINKDTTVKAIWTKNYSFKVTFNGNGGQLISGQVEQVVSDAKNIYPPVFEKKGHTLSWDVDYSIVGVDATINAVWTPKTYQITFDNNGGTWDAGFDDNYKISIKFGDNLSNYTLPTATKPNYKAEKWVIDAPNADYNGKTIGQIYDYDQNLKLKLSWVDANSYLINYTGGGSYSNQISSFKETDAPFLLNEPTLDGYDFAGFTGEGITVPQKSVTVTPSTVTADLNYVANWTPKSWTLSLNANGGECSNTNHQVTYMQEVTGLPTPTRAGYLFKGWKCGTYVFGVQGGATVWEIFNNPTELVAQWERAFTIRYELDYIYQDQQGEHTVQGKIDGADLPDKVDFLKEGQSLALALKDIDKPVLEGGFKAEFSNWCVKINGNMQDINEQVAHEDMDVDNVITIYAKYVLLVKIEFNLNYYNTSKGVHYPVTVGGQDSVEAVWLRPGAKLSDAIKNLPTPVEKQNDDEYTYKYWVYKNSKGKNVKVLATDQTILVDASIAKDNVITLYAYCSPNWIGPF